MRPLIDCALSAATDWALETDNEVISGGHNLQSTITTNHPPAQLTLVTSTVPDRLVKSYSLAGDDLTKTSAGQLIRGEYQVLKIYNVQVLAEILVSLAPNKALTYGVPRRQETRGTIASRKVAALGELTRTRNDFGWLTSPSIMFLDFDPQKGAEPLTAEELWKMLVVAVPELASAPAVIVASASSYIFNVETGEELKGAGGWHVYLLVADGQDIPRAGKAIYDRAWLSGHGRYDISSAGTLLERSLVDAAVWQPERFDFAAGAVCDPPLEQRRPAPLVINPNNAPFDTRQLPTVQAVDELDKLKAEARAAVVDEAMKIREAWIESRVAEELAAEKINDPEKRKEKAEVLRRTYRRGAEEMILQGDFVLLPEDGPCVPVDELLDDPEKWHMKRFADPLEPGYRNDNRIATAYLSPGEIPIIRSFAHGGQCFFLARHDASVATVATVSVAEWEKPLSLIVRQKSDPYPLDELPGTIGAAVREVVEFVQCPVALGACSALSVLSTVGQGLVDVRRAEKLEGPASLFFVAVAESGERKTTVDSYFSSPLGAWERKQMEMAMPFLQLYEAEKDAWEAKANGLLAAIKDTAKKGKSTAELESRLADLKRSQPLPPKVPRLVFGDTTPEALAFSLAKKWPVCGVLSSEAGAVLGSHAMNSDTVMRNLAMLNIFWDGETLKVDRKTSDSFVVQGVRLTMGLAVQPGTMKDFLDSSRGLARGTGFLARFLIAQPESTQGSRLYKEPPKDWPELTRFHLRLAELLDTPLNFNDQGELVPILLDFSPEAKREWVTFHNDVEAELRPGCEMAELKDVASKAADNAARLAALFHVFEAGLTGTISKSHMLAAREIVIWHLFEASRFINEIAHSKELTNAVSLEAWLIAHCRKEQVDQISTRDIQRGGPNCVRKGPDLDRALKELVDTGRVRILKEGRRTLVEVNPKLFEDGHDVD